MEDYIFLIIAVALSIFGALNQSRKKKAEENKVEQPRPKNPYEHPFLDFELNDVEDEEEEYERHVKEVPAKVEFKSSIDTKKDMAYQVTRFKSTLPDRKKMNVIKSSVRQKEEQIEASVAEESTHYLEDFSLRKAIVYSQILERKY